MAQAGKRCCGGIRSGSDIFWRLRRSSLSNGKTELTEEKVLASRKDVGDGEKGVGLLAKDIGMAKEGVRVRKMVSA